VQTVDADEQDVTNVAFPARGLRRSEQWSSQKSGRHNSEVKLAHTSSVCFFNLLIQNTPVY